MLPEKDTVNTMRDLEQPNKLEAEVVKKRLFSDKLYFQIYNAKPHVANIVTQLIRNPTFVICLDIGQKSKITMGNMYT